MRWIPGQATWKFVGKARPRAPRAETVWPSGETSTSPWPAPLRPHTSLTTQISALCITTSARPTIMAETQPAPRNPGQGSAAAELRQLLERETAKTRLRRLAVSFLLRDRADSRLTRRHRSTPYAVIRHQMLALRQTVGSAPELTWSPSADRIPTQVLDIAPTSTCATGKACSATTRVSGKGRAELRSVGGYLYVLYYPAIPRTRSTGLPSGKRDTSSRLLKQS